MILGNEKTAETFLALATDPSHAYLVTGMEGTGKYTLAKEFAKAVLSGKSNDPDIITVEHEKTTVSIDDIRTQVIDQTITRPYGGKWKIFIIPDADKMTLQAQNAILKTIEDPPKYVIVLLLAQSAEMLLETIRSRCVRIDLKPVPDSVMIPYLQQECSMQEQDAKMIAALSGGSLQKAVSYSENIEVIKDILSKLKDNPSSLAKVFAERDDAPAIVECWIRDILLYKASPNSGLSVFPDSRYLADKFNYKQLGSLMDAVKDVQVRLKANVNAVIVYEVMLRKITH